MRLLCFGFTFAMIVIGTSCRDDFKPRIAIIGSGIGGASASHFLTELFDDNLLIDIFESREVGGRLATVDIKGKSYEAGGAIIHSRNRYMQDFVKLLGMEKRPTPDGLRMGIWNGDEYVLKESSWEMITLGKLLWRYGLQPIKLHRYINALMDKFDHIYKVQDNGASFETVDDMLSAMHADLPQLRQISTTDHLRSLGFSRDLILELVEATLVVNYGQDTNVPAFVGSISIAGAGSDLWSVKGGNKEVPSHLIYRNSKVTVVPSRVETIRYSLNNDSVPKYEIFYRNQGSNNVMKSVYDVVVVAAPLRQDQQNPIEFIDFPKNAALKFLGDYQTTVATFVEGNLNLNYFGLDDSLDGILSCNPNSTKINSIGKVFPIDGELDDNSRVWKIFSKDRLSQNQIESMFSEIDEVKRITWKAYPKYVTHKRSDRFKLYESLYHLNAVEWAASAMEMSAIGGRNVALLIHKEFSSCCGDTASSTATKVPKCRWACSEKPSRHDSRKTEL